MDVEDTLKRLVPFMNFSFQLFEQNENGGYDIFSNKTFLLSIVHSFQADDRWFGQTIEIFLIVLYCIVIVVGLLGNSLVCYVVCRYKKLRTPRNIFILNLSACDILMSVVGMPFSLIRLTLKNWYLGEALCKIVPSLQTIDVFVSTLTIVAIAVDRYWAIVCATTIYPSHHTVYYITIIIWVVSIGMSIPMLMFHTVITPRIFSQGIFQMCTEHWPSESSKRIYTVVVALVQYFAPLLVISTLHARICQFMHMRIGATATTEAEQKRISKDRKRHRKNMLLLTSIAVTFGITWLPWTVLNLAADFDGSIFIGKNFNLYFAICLLIAMSSSCFNPIIYGWFNTNFRKAFMHSICWCKQCSEEGSELVFNKTDSREKKTGKYSSFQMNSGEKSY